MDMGAMGAAGAMGAGGGLTVVTILKYVLLTLGGGALLGFIGGKVFAAIRYPNPEKRQLFNTWQKIAVLVVTLASIGLIVGALLYKPTQPDPALGDPALSESLGEGEEPSGEAGGSATAGGSGGGGSVVIGGGRAVMIG